MRFNYYLKEGFRNLFKNKKSTIASMVTMMSTLIILGIFLLFGFNVSGAIKTIEQEQGIQAFILLETKQDRVKEIGEEIKKLDNVNSVEFKSRNDALEDLRKQFKNDLSAISGIDNPDYLPDSYIVKLTDIEKANEVKGQIEKIPDIYEVKNQQSLISALVTISKVGTTIGIIITTVLIVVSILIIANTIRLTVAARRREISIMKYVGATDSFIKSPFIVEGIFIGVIASIFAVVLLGIMYEAVIANISSTITGVSMATGGETAGFAISLLPFGNIALTVIAIFLVISVGLAIIASSLSMKKYLEV